MEGIFELEKSNMVEITENPIDTQRVLQRVKNDDCGATVLFLGTTRRTTDGRVTTTLDYDCYREMAASKLAELESQCRNQWPIAECCLVHRVGRVDIGEASVAVAVSAPHRGDAFESGQWLIDTLKEVVPVWKKENWADGTSEWVHPK